MSARHRLTIEQLETRCAPAVLHFRADATGLAVADTFIAESQPTTNHGGSPTLQLAGPAAPGGSRQILIRFDDMFGDGPGKIPTGSTINHATLRLWSYSGVPSFGQVRALNAITPWNDAAATWEGTGSFSPDNVTAYGGSWWNPAAEAQATPQGYQFLGGNLGESIRRWSVGIPNQGWAITTNSPTSAWTFASSEDPNPDRRPTLTVDFTPPQGETIPTYDELVGEPPLPTKLAWFDWADELRNARLDRVPTERTFTYYFSQAGDDRTGWGTIDRPWKSLAKAQEVLQSGAADIRLRFRRGDVWQETTALQTLQARSNGLTIDDYGDANLPRPRFTRFLPLAGAWTPVGGTTYSQPLAAPVGWVRETSAPYENVYYRAGSVAEVQARPYSWFVQSIGPGNAVLYVNAGRELSAVVGGFEACPANDAGWRIDKNKNARVQNLVLEGQGTATDGLGYGLMVIQDGNDEFVGVNLDIYYTGYHAFGHIGIGGDRNVATVLNVNAGLCVNRGGTGATGSGDVTVFVSYAGIGEAEYYQYECTARYGALPSSDWKAVPGLRHGSALYTHTNGDQWTQSLMLCWKTGADLCVNPVKSINILGAPRPATNIADARAFIVEDQPGRIASWWQQPGIVAINCVRDLTEPPQTAADGPFVGLNYGTLTIGGWLINCTLTVDAALFSVNEYVAVGTYGSSTQYINCHFEIRNANNPVSFHHTWLDPVQVSAGMKLTNSIISFSTVNGARTALALNNSPGTLRSNAYYLPNLAANPALGYVGDPGAITLPRPFPAGLVPSEFSPLFNAGTPNGLEYDQRRQPRGPLRTIGPLTGVPSPLPRDGFVVTAQAAFDIADDPVLALASARKIQLRFDEPVETGMTALQLVGPGNVGIPLSSLSYSADRKTVTFHTLAPLGQGRYSASFAGQPVGQFRVLPGDFTGDGKVDAADFLQFRLNFLGTNLTFDIDGDGQVDTRDFLILRQNFLASV